MEGLIKEGDEIMKEDGEATVKVAGLIAAAHKVEHSEIASYGTAIEHAKALGLKGVAKFLQQALREEKEADDTLFISTIEEVHPAAYAKDQMVESQL